MLPGGGQTRHSWDRAARELAEDGWQVFTIDMRGHGDSDWVPNGDYTIDGFVDDLRLVIEQVRQLVHTTAPPVVIGASLGGVTALIGEGESPGLVRALVLVDIVPRIEVDGAERIGEFMRSAPNGFESLDAVADAVGRYKNHRTRPASVAGLRRNVRQRSDGRWYWHWDPAFLRHGEGVANDLHRRMSAAAQRIKVPTLLVRGLDSDVVSDAGVDDLIGLLPTAAVVEVAASHMVAGDDNAVFVAATTRFLLELPSTGP
jgi:pimeloyl-ACP methyl ester carboxylesterase